MSYIVKKRPEFRKIKTYTCTYCKLKLKTHFKDERCYSCNKVYVEKPKYRKNNNSKYKYKKSGINKVFLTLLIDGGYMKKLNKKTVNKLKKLMLRAYPFFRRLFKK